MIQRQVKVSSDISVDPCSNRVGWAGICLVGGSVSRHGGTFHIDDYDSAEAELLAIKNTLLKVLETYGSDVEVVFYTELLNYVRALNGSQNCSLKIKYAKIILIDILPLSRRFHSVRFVFVKGHSKSGSLAARMNRWCHKASRVVMKS